MIEELLAWASSSLLGIGVSTTAILLVLAALQGRRGLKHASRLGTVYRYVLVAIGSIGVLLVLGVLTGVDTARIVELLGVVVDAVGGALP